MLPSSGLLLLPRVAHCGDGCQPQDKFGKLLQTGLSQGQKGVVGVAGEGFAHPSHELLDLATLISIGLHRHLALSYVKWS